MSMRRPLAAILRRYKNDLETAWTIADTWITGAAERLDPKVESSPLPDNVISLEQRQLHRAR